MPSATGPLWSLYPLLAVLAFCTFCLSGSHFFFCLPFFFLCLPFLAGIIGLLAGFHALFLRYPNSTDFVLQVISSSVSVFFFFTSAIETFCLTNANEREENEEGSLSSVTGEGGICDGIFYRSANSIATCRDLLSGMQRIVFERTGWRLPPARVAVSSALSLLAAAQLLTSTALSFYAASQSRLRVRVHHLQLALAVLLLLAGYFHSRFCCTAHFLFLPYLSGAFCLLQGLVSWRGWGGERTPRALQLSGSALSILLFSSVIFSFICWLNERVGFDLSVLRYCDWQPSLSASCYRRLSFSHPYFFWTPEQIRVEVGAVQLIVYISLFVFSLLYFFLSMKATFALEEDDY